jgi:glycerol kinase
MMQFQADLLGVPVVRPAIIETTALGAAYLAGLAVGFWKDVGEISTQWKVDKTFEPKMAASHVAELRGRWNEALLRSEGWAPKEKKPVKTKSRKRK